MTVYNGTQLQLQGGLTNCAPLTVELMGAGPAGGATLLNVSGNNTMTSPIIVFSNVVIGSDADTLTLNSSQPFNAGYGLSFIGAGNISVATPIANASSVSMSGSGTLALSGTNTYTGGTYITSGNRSAVIDC